MSRMPTPPFSFPKTPANNIPTKQQQNQSSRYGLPGQQSSFRTMEWRPDRDKPAPTPDDYRGIPGFRDAMYKYGRDDKNQNPIQYMDQRQTAKPFDTSEYQPNLNSGPYGKPDNLDEIITKRLPYSPPTPNAPEMNWRMAEPKRTNNGIYSLEGRGRSPNYPPPASPPTQKSIAPPAAKNNDFESWIAKPPPGSDDSRYASHPMWSWATKDEIDQFENYRKQNPSAQPPKTLKEIDAFYSALKNQPQANSGGMRQPTQPGRMSNQDIQSQMNFGGGFPVEDQPMSNQDIQSQMNFGGGFPVEGGQPRLMDSLPPRQKTFMTYGPTKPPEPPNQYMPRINSMQPSNPYGRTQAPPLQRQASNQLPPTTIPPPRPQQPQQPKPRSLARTILPMISPVFAAPEIANGIRSVYNYWNQ